jgi:hypothetical protein
MNEVPAQSRIEALEIELELWKEETRIKQLEIAHLRSENARLIRALADKIQDPIGEL